MPSLRDVLQRTMLFTAAADAGIDPFETLRSLPADPISMPRPTLNPDLPASDQPVWHWEHDPERPAVVSNVTALLKHAQMAMPVCERIELERVTVTVEDIDGPIDLPLTPQFAIAKFSLKSGAMLEKSKGWWQLEAKLDPSILIVFAYEIPPASGAKPRPVSLFQLDRIGARLFPAPDVPANDPDAPSSPAIGPQLSSGPVSATMNQAVVAYIAPTWVICAFGLTACKQRADFEPGEILGAGRIYPHAMVMSNHRLLNAESQFHMIRPAKTMPHDLEMEPDIGTIQVADTNEAHDFVPAFIGENFKVVPVIPVWSNFFDYYDLKPPVGVERCFVDRDKTNARTVAGAIRREKSTRFDDAVYEDSTSFKKLPFQGEFDNMHVAPRMRFENGPTRIGHIAMAPFCVHDCLHTHTRWGTPGRKLAPSNLGFAGRIPYAAAGSPLVPNNQSVFITLTSAHAFRYRANAAGPIQPGIWTVFYHHGSAYALEVADLSRFSVARMAIAALAVLNAEPGTRVLPAVGTPFGVTPPVRVMADVNPVDSIAAFYHRLQFTGEAEPDRWLPRINILDLPRCRLA